MKVNIFVKPQLFHVLLLCAVVTTAHAQQAPKMPVNYPGVLGGIEWNTLSAMAGVEYERFLYTKDNMLFGIRGSYIFPYQNGNAQLLNRPCCEVATLATALVTANFFTSRQGLHSGVFIEVGIGAGIKNRKWQEAKETIARPALELGAGWLFPLGKRLALKWTNTITFPSKQGGITFTRLAVGI